LLGSPVKSHWWSREDILLILLVGLLLYLPGLGPWRDVLGTSYSGPYVPLFDRDEPRFASAARTMLQTGDYIVPRFNGDLRPDKPPLVYWAMTVAYRLVGINELGARLPSAFFGTLTLVVIYFVAGGRFGRKTGLVAALMLAACGLFVAEARLATADATMVFFVALCMGAAWNAWEAGNLPLGGMLPKVQYMVDHKEVLSSAEVKARAGGLSIWQALLFWLALAGGTLTKGVPLAFVLVPMVTLSIATGQLTGAFGEWRKQRAAQMVVHLPSLAWHAVIGGNWRWWKQLRPWVGVPILAVLVGSWFVAAGIRTDGELIRGMIGVHLIMRVFGEYLGNQILTLLHMQGAQAESMSKYGQPPFFYLATVWVTFWPWTPLLVPGGFYLWRRVRGKSVLAIDRRPYQFILAWIIPMWIILESSRGKLLQYVLPLYLAMIILCADMLVASWHRLTEAMAARWMDYARWVFMGVWFALGIAAIWVPRHFVHDESIFQVSILLAGLLFAGGVATALAWGSESWIYWTVLCWAVALAWANAVVVPQVEEFRISQQVMDRVGELERRGYAYGAMGYEEPSLVFYAEHSVPMRTQATGDEWQKKVEAFFAAGPKERADGGDGEMSRSLMKPFGTPGVDMAMIVDDATLAEFKSEGRVFFVLEPVYVGFRSGDGKSEKHVTVITNVMPVAASASAPATAASPPAVEAGTAPATGK
jgi:4-amino-4-deoxy-L-arabinose transferase-like glycosyltransferase